jgi:hypothetical protein
MNFNRNSENWLKLCKVLGIHPRSGEAAVCNALWGLLLSLSSGEREPAKVVADDESNEPAQASDDDERQELMDKIEAATGKRPHHFTGIEKLRAMLAEGA